MCLRFYHAKCLTCDLGASIPFMTNYQFFCKRCGSSENFTKRPASFSQMCLTAVANLAALNPERKFFSKDKEIIPYVEINWESLTTTPRRVKTTWHTTITKTMIKDTGIFCCQDDSSDQSFGLVNQDLTKIGPNCESLLRSSGPAFKAEPKAVAVEPPIVKGGRGTKRKTVGDGPSSTIRQRRGDVAGGTRLIPRGYPLEHPFNKDGYRYILAEPDVHAPNWQAFDDSIEWAGKPIPGFLYRKYLETEVMLALHDRAPQLKISDDRLSVTGDKGYSMVRATYGVSKGAWYYEVTIDEMPSDSATRIGWSQSLGILQAPCGYDKFSYSWRSRKGTRFHQSKGCHYSEEYKVGDVLGLHISLPEEEQESLLPNTCKDMPLVKFKSHLYYEEKDLVSETEKKMQPLSGSQMTFYKNGESQGVAFKDVFKGVYYPAISLYKNATISVNFGPNFKHPPKDIKYKAMSEAVEETIIKHTLADAIVDIEHEGQLSEF
ncbi:hypothetical protein CAPTEDRAFT_182172 [Capitella teleta]|uniref:B30.2/SPRY domain-containing protein n=1 Tax=Capitella teleta TaxID=283909 RepID=R7UEQ5_CAPTE|nr:hypothetical protein CAPTEDRAFT_182172 [Capitella teleta]|eukprot:ELU02273.1 hypothetical protein CAPTEDRAFT_182172 [Capitella teleta]